MAFKKGLIPWNKGRINIMPTPWNKGKKDIYSKETKRKWTAIRTGKKASESTRIKMSETKKKQGTKPPVCRGEDSHFWKGGITPKNLIIRTSTEYKLWRKAVFERDEYTCQDCSDKKGGNLQAHHIKPFSLFPELRVAIDNGITLCKKCHKFNHKKNGKK